MNALKARRKWDEEQAVKARIEEQRREEEYLMSLPPEEQKKYIEERNAKRQRAMGKLAGIMAMNAMLNGPYGKGK